MAALNYATEYAKELAQAYPYTLYFGALWTAVKEDVKFLNSNTIQLPSLTVKGRKNGNRDSIGTFGRNFDNAWESKTLKNHRTWDTLVHPRDIDETNKVASISNITKVFNEEQKFPEMDAEAINAVYSLKNAIEPVTALAKGTITAQTVLTYFDELMDKMDEKISSIEEKIKVIPEMNERINSIEEKVDAIEETIKVIPDMNRTLLLLEHKMTTELPALYEIYSLNYETQKENEKKLTSLEKTTGKHSIQIANLEETAINHTNQLKELIS